MATGAVLGKEGNMAKKVQEFGEPSNVGFEQQRSAARGPCSRRKGRKLAGRLGMLGRLFASGKLSAQEISEKSEEYIHYEIS